MTDDYLNEIKQFAVERPTSMNDDLYDWAVDWPTANCARFGIRSATRLGGSCASSSVRARTFEITKTWPNWRTGRVSSLATGFCADASTLEQPDDSPGAVLVGLSTTCTGSGQR